MCESVAIVDLGRLVAGGRVRDLKRASGRRTLRLAVEGDIAGLAGGCPGSTASAGRRRRRSSSSAGSRPGGVLAAVLAKGASVTRFEVVEPSLEALFIEHVGRPADDDARRSPRRRRRIDPERGRGLMARRDPLLPNAGIVARREYHDRTRSPLFLVSTVILAGLAVLAALAPIAIRYFDRQTVTQIAVVSSDAELARGRSRSPIRCSTSRPAGSSIRPGSSRTSSTSSRPPPPPRPTCRPDGSAA